jgi:aspartate/methionine/tyrosine aminotransferase
MKFQRMSLEEWFDKYQYKITYDIGESAIACLSLEELDLDLRHLKLRYGYHEGSCRLRERIANLYPGLSEGNVLVTNGCAEALFDLSVTLLKPGDHVVVQKPNYPSNYEVPRSLGCHIDMLHLKFDDGFQLNLERLSELITPKTKFLSLTYPNNPTGAMISEDTLREVIALVEAKNCYLVFDETYRDLTAHDPLPPAASLSPRAISVSTMSKAYGLPGIRIGWLATQEQALLQKVLATREQVSICNSVLNEEIAWYMLGERNQHLRNARNHVAENFRILKEWIQRQSWLEWVEPRAGVVCLPLIADGFFKNPEEFYVRLAEKYKTFVIPGRCFELDNRFFRLGFGGKRAHLEVGLQSLEQAAVELTRGS